MARVEVKGDLGSSFTNLAELKVKGIYLNNVKQKRADAAVVKTTKASAPDWTTAYTAGGTKSNLYNTFIGTPITKFDSGKADGYNFFHRISILPLYLPLRQLKKRLLNIILM